MNGRMFAIAGGGLAAAVLLVGAVGYVSAQGPGTGPGAGSGHGPGSGMHTAMHTQMHANGQVGPYHDQMQAAIAAALGISVDELQAELAAGKTVATIAQERGVSLDALRAAMLAVHQTAGLPGPGGGPQQGMGPRAGAGPGTGGCPFAGQ